MNLDVKLFKIINAFADGNVDIDAFFVFGATTLFAVMWLLFIVMLFVVYGLGEKQSVSGRMVSWWKNLLPGPAKVSFLMTFVAIISSLVSYAVSQFIGRAYFRERPFVALDNVVLLIEKSALDKSFPSDHATLAFALAFSVWLFNRRWGALFLVLATLVAFSRVYVGVHYPSDIVGGAVLAFVIAWSTKRIFEKLS